MAIQLYDTRASRNLIRAEQEMLKHMEPIQVIGTFGTQKKQPKNKTDTVVFRRLLPFGATSNAEQPAITAGSFVTSEGQTPTANTISYVDVTTTLQQFAVLFKFSSKAELTYEDDIPGDMVKLTGETLAEVAELVAWNQIKSGSSVSYCSSTGVAARTSVDSRISIGKIRQAARTMATNRAMRITERIKPGPNFGTAPVEPGFIVFCHTDCTADVRDLPGFTKREEYGSSMKPIHDREVGAVENFRFVDSPLLAAYAAGGAAIGATGMKSVGAANVDVYPYVVIAADAFGHISLKGMEYSGVTPTLLSSQTINHANPSGMFGYVGANFWYQCVRLNENWMTRIESGVTDL